MIEGMGLRAVGELVRFTSPKTFMSIAKYMYLKSLLRHYEIALILDVGANQGQFAKAMRHIGFKGRIISFEPVSAAFKQLILAAREDRLWRAWLRGKIASGELATSRLA